MTGVPAESLEVDWDKAIKADMIEEKLESGEFDAITLVYNETSTGLLNPLEEIAEVIKRYPDVMFLVDAVSAMAGVKIEVDRLGIDICLAGVQKAFALPPGLTVASISERALKKAEKVPPRSYYFNLPLLYKYHLRNQSPVTPVTPLMFALNTQMDAILEEGLENRFIRHEKMAAFVQKWAKKYFDIFPEPGYESKTLTCLKNTRGISVAGLNEELGKYSTRISNGYGTLKEDTFRIAHMGDTQLPDIQGLLALIEHILDF
jgi:aspartate aminotransferase-like enzyme